MSTPAPPPPDAPPPDAPTPGSALGDMILPTQPTCASEAGSWCATFYQWTSSDFLARSADAIVSTTLSVTLIVLLALAARLLIHRTINRVVEGAASSTFSRLFGRGQQRSDGSPPLTPRRAQRARTIGSVLRSISSMVILVIAAVMILAEFGVALGPILASAGIVGVAVGFGAQNLVRDFLSGMFMLLEDQYGVGDIVDLGEAVGVIESVGLRITTLRDIGGTLWYVRNGEILRVGNMSQGYAVAVIDIPFGHTHDMPTAISVAEQAVTDRLSAKDMTGDVLESPETLGVETVGPEGITLRLTVKVKPGRQFAIQRALRAAVSDAFEESGVPRPTILGINGRPSMP